MTTVLSATYLTSMADVVESAIDDAPLVREKLAVVNHKEPG